MSLLSCEITIGFPVYNVEPYVERSLLSTLDQDFDLPYEILIVDDCGTDRSMEIIRHLLASHPHGSIARIIHNEHNMGLGAVRNTIINEAAGRYLTFLDSDDCLMPNSLSLLYYKAIDSKAEMTVGGIVNVYEGKEYPRKRYPEMTVQQKNAGVYLLSRGIVTHIEFGGKLFLTEFMRQHDIHCVHRIIEDSIPDAIALIEAERISLIPETVYIYIRREGSILATIYNKTGSDDTAFVYTDILKKMQDLIRNRFGVPGIFDLYMLRIKYNLGALLSSTWTPQQSEYIDHQIGDCLDIVPSFRYLSNKHDRLIWLLCRKRMTLERYRYVSRVFANSIWGRILRNLLNLIPCRTGMKDTA